VSISGLYSGISGRARSRRVKVGIPIQNGLRSSFVGAKAAGEQQAGSEAASGFAPAAAWSGCFGKCAMHSRVFIC
jgi:hypothetical protein